MSEEYFNQNYAHLGMVELMEELCRLKDLHEQGDFQSEEIDNVKTELLKRLEVF